MRYLLVEDGAEEGSPVFLTYPARGDAGRCDALLFVVKGAGDCVVEHILGLIISQKAYACVMQQASSFSISEFSFGDLRASIIGCSHLKDLGPTPEEVILGKRCVGNV